MRIALVVGLLTVPAITASPAVRNRRCQLELRVNRELADRGVVPRWTVQEKIVACVAG